MRSFQSANRQRHCLLCHRAPCTCSQSRRAFSTVEQHQDKIDTINEAFVTARDEIEYAKEEAETVYFNEAHETAKSAVAETLDLYNGLLGTLEESERGKLQRSMGLKMEQLKAELEVLDSMHA
ncbi:g7463 [Coccomyxa elongata]